MTKTRIEKIEESFNRYFLKRPHGNSLFRNDELTLEKRMLTIKFLSDINICCQQEDVANETDRMLQVRQLLLTFKYDNAVLEMKHAVYHISSAQIRLLGKNWLVAKYESSVTQSALNARIEHHLAKIEETLKPEQVPADTQFITLTLAKLMVEKMFGYYTSLTDPCGPLTLEKRALIQDALSIMENIITHHSSRPSNPGTFLDHLHLLLYAIHNTNAALEKSYNKAHVSYYKSRTLDGLPPITALFKRTILQSRLSLLTESFIDIISEINKEYSISTLLYLHKQVAMEDLEELLPSGLAVIPPRTDSPRQVFQLFSV